MTCAEAERHFLAHEQGEPTPEGFAEHLAGCHACRRALDAFTDAGRLLRDLSPAPVGPRFVEDVKARTRQAAERRTGRPLWLILGPAVASADPLP